MLENLIKEAKEELKDWAQGEVAEYEVVPDDVGHQIFEIADSSTPVYYSDMMQCANEDYSLMHKVPECRGEEGTPMRLLQLNIFDRISQELYEYWQELESELEEDLEILESAKDAVTDAFDDPDLDPLEVLEGLEDVPEYLWGLASAHYDELEKE